MTKQEGDKPHLSIVPSEPNAQGYGEQLLEIVKTLMARKANREPVDAGEVFKFLDSQADNSLLKDWLADNGEMTRSQFDRALAKAERNKHIFAELGFIPKDCQDFVVQYVLAQKIKLSANEQLIRNMPVQYGDVTIRPQDAQEPGVIQCAYRIGNAGGQNLDDFRLELRLLRDRLKLVDYRDSNIQDAVRNWAIGAKQAAKIQMFMEVRYEKGAATGQRGTAMWAAMEAACFDVRETRPGFAIDVIRKFMWQVKRKGMGLPVTNHLMPVITGPQGKGKSTFVEALVSPLHDAMKRVDFKMVTDERIIDIWKANILFIDEMSNFSKADVDAVKNVVTSPTLTRRPMRSNDTVQVHQEATFIGCANKSLAQLIRDDTGGRRFAELVWTLEPDWAAMNAIDWEMLWRSVDEDGPCPMGAETSRLLAEQQEENRNKSPVEEWALVYGHQYKDWTSAETMHLAYRTWEQDAYPRSDMSQAMFGRTLTNLIQSMPTFPMTKRSSARGKQYKYWEK